MSGISSVSNSNHSLITTVQHFFDSSIDSLRSAVEPAFNAIVSVSKEQRDQLQLEQELNEWCQDPLVSGNKEQAKKKLLENYRIKTNCLLLNGLQLTSVPHAIRFFTHLNFLWLNDNSLTHLPVEIGYLDQLENLEVSNNRLTQLPGTVSFWKKLRGINLAGNEFKKIPPHLFSIRSIIYLDLSRNPLTEIPPAIKHLQSLRTLILEDMPMPPIPPEMAALPELSWYGRNCSEELHRLMQKYYQSILTNIGSPPSPCLEEALEPNSPNLSNEEKES